MKLTIFPCAAAILFASFATVTAHQLWIEDTPEGRLVVRFAEYGEAFEKSPGALDSISLPSVFVPEGDGKGKFVVVQRNADHFLLGDLSAKASAQIETAFSVRGGGDKPARKPVFYARWHAAGSGAASPALTLDLVPTGNAGEAKIMFRGEPVAEAKVTAFVPGGEEQELTSDKAGVVRVPATKPGFYLLVGRHQPEAQKGFWAGRAYEAVSHSCSLAWRVTEKKP